MNTLSDFRLYGKVTPTRFNDGDVSLYVTKTGDVWRVLVDQDGRCAPSGEHAKTKFECFTCVLPEVAKQWGVKV